MYTSFLRDCVTDCSSLVGHSNADDYKHGDIYKMGSLLGHKVSAVQIGITSNA